MSDDVSVYETIAAMAIVTLFCRCAGYMIFSKISPSPAVKRALAHLPGCIFAAYVVPALVAGPLQNWAGAAATMAMMAKSRNLGFSIVAGVVAIFVFDYFLRLQV